MLALRIKRWDQRRDAQGRLLALVQEADTGRLRLLRADPDGARLQALARWSGPAFAPEQLCLYRDAQGLLQLGQGSVVELQKIAGEPMDVYVNQRLIARGEVVVINEKFGIRLTDIISPIERVKQLA